MRKIIDGKKYDTETATLVGSYSPNANRRDFRWVCEELYRKRTGEYFLYGEGGPMSKYSRQVEQNGWAEGEKIIPLSQDEAMEWAEKNLEVDEYEAEFGEVEEDEKTLVGDNIKKYREAAGLTQTQLAEKIGTDQRQIWRYESSNRAPSAYQIIDIAKALNVDPGDLLK
jgi:DNA-binding XRE family transcriptional regulator